MNFFGNDWTFWFAIIVATIVRVMSSPYHSVLRAGVMIVTSLIFAVVFVDPVLDWLKLDPEIYRTAVAVLIAFTADGIMRLIILASTNPAEVIDLWRRLRFGAQDKSPSKSADKEPPKK